MEYSPKELTNFGILNVCGGAAGSAGAFSAPLPQRVKWIRRSALSRYTVYQ